MSDTNLEALIAGATAYEELLVPALFQEWRSRLIAAAQIEPGDRVLDVACGTGVLARAAAARVGPRGSVTGLHPSPGMLAVARQLAPEIEWRHGVAESLPLPHQSFDVAVSQFGLMFFTDRRQAVREMLRVLPSGGRIAVAVWDSLDNISAYAAQVALVQRVAGERSALALRAPFSLGDRSELTALFVSAGAARVAVTTHLGMARFPTLRSMVEADILGWLPLMGTPLTEDQVHKVFKEADEVLSPYVTADGKVAFQISVHIVAGTKP
jgi:SAM-dependent methyltransferase